MLIFFSVGPASVRSVGATCPSRSKFSTPLSGGRFKKNIPVLRGVVHTAESDGTEGEGNKNW